MQSLIVVEGPTGSGKTARAIELAHERNGEVISCDSRQIYKGFDITTCKATSEEMEGIPHHLMSFLNPEEVYSAHQFRQDADRCIQNIVNRGKVPIIAGGTYFYLFALLFDKYLPEVPKDNILRASFDEKSTETLYALLQEQDAERAIALHPNDRVRIVRALEILSNHESVPKAAPTLRYQPELISLRPERDKHREKLKDRVSDRLDSMLQEISEARSWLTNDIANRLGFDFSLCLMHLDGTLSRDELIERLTAKDWQYSKRQLLWSGYLEKMLAD